MEIPITIGRATLSDLKEIVAIEESCLSSEEIVSYEFLEESIRKIADTFLVARDENQLIGYVLGESQSLHHTWIEIRSLAIHPDHRGQGLGTLLLANLKQVAVEGGYEYLRLTCPDDLLSYFEMNDFATGELLEAPYARFSGWNLIWVNPFYQEEV